MGRGKYVLLSHVLRQDTPSYGNRDKVVVRVNSTMKAGETANSSCWVFTNNHIGTHIDVPRHFSINGKKTTDYPIEDYVFDCCMVIDMPKNDACLLTPNDFEVFDIDEDVELLLVRTGYENLRGKDEYWNNNPGLSPNLAGYLRIRFPKLRCIGFDFISVTSWKHRDEGKLAHKEFLAPENGDREIWCIEDMSLTPAQGKLGRVVVSPLFVEDGNGACVTIIAEIKE